ncbi:amino acid permease-like protein [Strigomonas culicis]|nr:amino acid permease-like protein [Strigomonas culicis]|eukprot:EPY32635.1 amino acid permease-like protein [Strigomonas culicis]
MLLLVYGFTVYSIFLLIRVGELHDLHSYEALALSLVGPFSKKLSSILIVTFCWGVAVMYVVVMGDFIKPLLTARHLHRYVGRRLGMILFWTCVMGPLSLLRQVNSLQYASIVGSAATLLLAAALVLHTINSNPTLHHIPLVRWDSNSLGSLSTFVFSYCCQPVAFSIYSEMKDASVRRMSLCAGISMLTCTVLYVVTGFFGVAAFGDETKPNVLSNFADHLDKPYVQLAFFGMAITVTMAFPITIFPTRESVVLALGYTEESPAPPLLSSGIGGVLAFLALLTSLFVPNIRVLFDILGGVCGGSLSFLLPGLFAIRSELWTRERVGLTHVVGAWATFILGVGICALGTYNSFYTNVIAGSA